MAIEKSAFVSQNWLTATMGTLIFVLGGIVGTFFNNRLTDIEVWKNTTDVSRATRTGELKSETSKALERIEAQEKWIKEDHEEIKHLHEHIERLERERCK